MATSIPPHNVGEICDALLHVIKAPNATIEKLVDLMPGPDFPTGGILVEGRASIVEAYRTGRGAFRLRSEEHTSELQSLMRISYAVFCLKKKKQTYNISTEHINNRYTQLDINHTARQMYTYSNI